MSDGNVRNLNSRSAIANKLFFYTALPIIFTTCTRNGFKKLHCEWTFILCETSLVLKKRQVFKGLVTHNDILKIYRIIQYFKNIFKRNMVKIIFKIYKKIRFLLKKISSV